MLVWIVFIFILLIISLNDFLFFRIEDEAIIFLIGLYVLSCIFGVSGVHFIFAFKIMIGVFIGTYILNQLNLIGGGDVKLLIPLVLFAESNLDKFFIGVSIMGLVLCLFYMAFGKNIFKIRQKIIKNLMKRKNNFKLLNVVLLSFSRINKKKIASEQYIKDAFRQEIPYGIALSGGGIFAVIDKFCG